MADEGDVRLSEDEALVEMVMAVLADGQKVMTTDVDYWEGQGVRVGRA